MLALPSSVTGNGLPRRFFVWCLAFCFAGLTLIAAAQSPAPGQNSDTNGPVAIPPDAQTQPQPAVQPQPAPDAWDRFWQIQKVSEDDEWTRHFRIGAIGGLNISANFKMKGTFNISGNNAANGIYDDGYVRTDNTGDAQGQTGYWGYNNASQLSGSSLTMHSTTSYTPVTSSSREESGSFPGFDMAYGGNLWAWKGAQIGWEFGFGLLPISITENSPMSVNVNQNIYTFNTGVIIVPTAPYQGGPSGYLEPTISTNFISSPNPTNGIVTGSYTLDVMLYTFRLGPTLYWDLNEDLGLTVGAGPALGLVSGSLKYDETVTTDSAVSNKGRVDGTDVVYGGYVNAMLTYHVEEHGDLYLGAQYMPMGSASISGGGREARLNLSGQVYITAGINWPF